MMVRRIHFRHIALLGTFVAAVLANDSHAAIIQVFSPGELAQGPYVLEDFEDDTFVTDFTFSASTGITRALASNFADSVTPSGLWGLSTFDFPDPITITFAQPASSVGVWFGNDDTCCSNGFTAYMDIYDSNGLAGTIGVDANMNDWADQFLGFNSDLFVTSVTIRYGSGSDVGLFTYLDDVYANVVPEPSSFALAGAGLVLAGVVRRRRHA